MFDELKASEYEMDYSKQWMNESFEKIMADIYKWRGANMPKPNPHYVDLFFAGNLKFEEFADRVKDKTCLELSSGPCGIFPLWGHWLSGRQIIIDPLIVQYDDYMKATFGKSWFLDRVEKMPVGAETKIESLVNKIDGFILWRNGIDHFKEWQQAIENLSGYAADGCTLLFWGDHKHIEAPDEGHNAVVTETAKELEEAFQKYGWNIIQYTPSIRDRSKTLDVGFVAVKGNVVSASLPAVNSSKAAAADTPPAEQLTNPEILKKKQVKITVTEYKDTTDVDIESTRFTKLELLGVYDILSYNIRKDLDKDA